MRPSAYIALLAGSAAAQSSVTVFNLFQYNNTLTRIGADATATTYKNDCPPDNAGVSVVPDAMRPVSSSASAAITPAPSPRSRTVSKMTTDVEDYSFCEPYTLKQGPSTWEFHLTDPLPGAWTADMSCKWQGAITAADLTCTYTQSGYVPEESFRGVTTSVIPRAMVTELEAFQVVAVVSSSSGASRSSPSQTGTPTPSASQSGSGASGASASSTGMAPAGPLPTGVLALVGGAAGVFAAALAL